MVDSENANASTRTRELPSPKLKEIPQVQTSRTKTRTKQNAVRGGGSGDGDGSGGSGGSGSGARTSASEGKSSSSSSSNKKSRPGSSGSISSGDSIRSSDKSSEASSKSKPKTKAKAKAVTRTRARIPEKDTHEYTNQYTPFKKTLEEDNATATGSTSANTSTYDKSQSSPPIQNDALLQIISSASSGFSYQHPHRVDVNMNKGNKGNKGKGMILLEEKQLEVINIARRCIRSAASTISTNTSDNNNNDSYSNSNSDSDSDLAEGGQEIEQLVYLRIAIHCLRSVIPIMISDCRSDGNASTCRDAHGNANSNANANGSKSKRMEGVAMVIKLLYHCIVTVESTQKRLFTIMLSCSNGGTSATSEDAGLRAGAGASVSTRSDLEESLIDAFLICLCGYQMLGCLLSTCSNGYGCLQESEYENQCQCQRESQDGTENTGRGECYCNSLSFPVPFLDGMRTAQSDTTDVNVEEMGLSIQQIIKIATQSILSMGGSFSCIMKAYFSGICFRGQSDDEEDQETPDTMFRSAMCVILNIEEKAKDASACELSSFDILRNLICQIALPWSTVTLLLDGSDKDQTQASMIFVQKGSKILLDIASFAEKTCSRTIQGRGEGQEQEKLVRYLQKQSLLMQQDSIIMALVHFRKMKDRWVLEDAFGHDRINFEFISQNSLAKATVSAKRAVLTYSGTDACPLVLTTFHKIVGSVLDQLADQNEMLDKTYVEYCIFRAMHLAQDSEIFVGKKIKYESSTRILSAFPFPFYYQGNVCKKSTAKVATLSICFLYLAMKHSIALFDDEKDYLALINDVIRYFRSSVLDESEHIGSDTLNLAHRSLSMLQVQSFAHKEMNTASVKTVKECRWSYTAARILGECLGPLSIVIMKIMKKDVAKHYSLALDCYLRGATLMDTLATQSNLNLGESNESCCRECLNASDKFIDRCRQLSLRCPSMAFHPTLGSIGRAISNVAKRRMSEKCRRQYSLRPFFVSLEIFAIVRDPLLPSRFSQLSAVLQSLDLNRESLGAMGHSIAYSIKKYESKTILDSSTLDDVLLLCDDYIRGDIMLNTFLNADFLPNELNDCIRKAAELFVKILNQSSGHCTSFELDMSQSYSSLEAEVCSLSECQDTDMIEYFMQKSLGVDISTCIPNALAFRLGVAFEFMRSLGVAFGESIRRRTNELHFQQFLNYFSTSIAAIKKTFLGIKSVHLASLYIVAEANLRSLRELTGGEDGECYYFANLAETELSGSLLNMNLAELNKIQIMIAKLSVLTFSTCLEQSRRNLHIRTDVESILILVAQIILGISECMKEWMSPNSRKYNNALLFNLFKIMQVCEVNSSLLSLTRCAFLLKKIMRLIGKDTLLQLEDAIIPSIAVEQLSIIPIGSTLEFDSKSSPHSQQHAQVRTKVDFLFCQLFEKIKGNSCIADISKVDTVVIVDLYATSFTLQSLMMTECFDNLPYALLQLSLILSKHSDKLFVEPLPCVLQLSLSWLSSSCYLALYLGHCRLGDHHNAYIAIRQYCDITKLALRSLTKINNDIISDISIDSDKFLPLYISSYGLKRYFQSRFAASLEHLAHQYCKLGDPKRAKRYIIAAAGSMHIIPKTTAAGTMPTLAEIASLVDEGYFTVRQLHARTRIMDILSLCAPQSSLQEIVSNIVESLKYESTSLQISTMNLWRIDWLQEAANLDNLCKL